MKNAETPGELPRVAHGGCGECLDRNWKCNVIACGQLSEQLDMLDQEIKTQEGNHV